MDRTKRRVYVTAHGFDPYSWRSSAKLVGSSLVFGTLVSLVTCGFSLGALDVQTLLGASLLVGIYWAQLEVAFGSRPVAESSDRREDDKG